MPLKGLFKGDGGGGGGRDGSSGGGSSSRDSSTHSGRDGKLMSKAKALLATAAAPLSARGVRRHGGLGKRVPSACRAHLLVPQLRIRLSALPLAAAGPDIGPALLQSRGAHL